MSVTIEQRTPSTRAAATTIDLKKEYAALYRASAKVPEFLDVPELRYIAIGGQGSPEGGAFQEAIAAMYAVAYGCKLGAKKELALDYSVMPLEGLWWMASGGPITTVQSEDARWQLLILVPPELPEELFKQVQIVAQAKAPKAAVARLITLKEGRAAQVMHIGPYDAEAATIERLEAFARESGFVFCGKHHEIYLGDPRRAAPEKLRTIIRHPVQ